MSNVGNRQQAFREHFTKMLRDLADRVESGEVEPRAWTMDSPIAQFAPPGAATYDNIHNGEMRATIELTWEDRKAVDAFWKKVDQYGGLMPARIR